MPAWSGKTRGGISGYKIFVFIIKHLGLSFAYFLLAFVVIYFIFTSPQAIRSLYYYFRKRHKFSFVKSLWLICKNYYVFGQTLIDKLTLLSGQNNKLSFDFEGENYLHKLVDEKKGGMLISAHVGSFEIAGYLLKRINTKINILMYEAEHENIKKYLNSVYTGVSAHIITIKEDMSHVYEINKVFENHEFLCLHGDRFLENTRTINISFMGQNALFPAGPFFLALKYNIPVSYVFAMKERKFHYHFYATPPQLYFQEKLNLKKREASLMVIMKNYVNTLENMLQKYPEQWFNYYYFWKEK